MGAMKTQSPGRRDALDSLVRNFGCAVRDRGGVHVRDSGTDVERDSAGETLTHLNESMSTLSAAERAVLARQFLTWAIYTAVSCSGGHLNNVFDSKDGTKEKNRAALRRLIKLARPAILLARSSATNDTLDPDAIIDALFALDAGERADIFTPSKNIGKQRNSYSLFKLRYSFLYLQSCLEKLGYTAQRARKLIEKNSQTSDEAVRHWKKPVKRRLHPKIKKAIRARIKAATIDGRGVLSSDLIKGQLKVVGEAYKIQRAMKK